MRVTPGGDTCGRSHYKIYLLLRQTNEIADGGLLFELEILLRIGAR